MRDLSAIIQSILTQESQPVWLSVDITLADGITTFRCAEIELTVSSLNLFGASVNVDPVFYPALLKQDPGVKFVRGKSPSGGELSVFDLDHALGVLTGQLSTVLEGAKIVICTCWEKQDGNFEADIYFIGKIRDVRAEDDETRFTVISDTDAKTALVANRALTQRCLADFGDDRCRRPAELIAPGETCSNIFDDAEFGCLSKRWQFAFWGVPILDVAPTQATYGNGGWGDGTIVTNEGGCAWIENYIAVLNSNRDVEQIKLKKAKAGMFVVDAMRRVAMIEKIEFLHCDSMYEVICANGARTECSDTHPLIRSEHDATGTAVELMFVDEEIVCLDLRTMTHEKSKIVAINPIAGREIAKISLSNQSASLYLTCSADDNENDFLMIEGHNNKPVMLMN